MIKLENRNQFIADWIRIAGDYARDHLRLDIPSNSDIANDQLLAQYFERIPKKRRREIKFADTFTCPEKLQDGWEFLKTKIESGSDLYPHLSRQIMHIEARDQLLMHWSINHFHLGTETDLNGLIQGGNDIVYAYLDDDYFYAIAILQHGHWKDFGLIETIKRNWPAHPNISTDMTTAEICTLEDTLELRKCQVNAPVSFADGSFNLGMGQTLGGTSMLASLKANSIRGILGQCQAAFEQSFLKYFPDVAIESGTPVVAHLELKEDHCFSVFLPDLKRRAKLEIGTIDDLIEKLKS